MQGVAFQVYFSVIEDGGVGLQVCIRELGRINIDLSRFSIDQCLAGGVLGNDGFFLGLLPSHHDCGAHSRHLLLTVDLCNEVMDDVVKCFVQNIG